MSDLSAVLLTMGEATAARALTSVKRQTSLPCETIVVEGVAPYSRAVNSAASRVSSEFMVLVDADMILDENCFSDLRAGAADRVGIVTGDLRDPILGRIQGIKLLRTRCVRERGYPDSPSPDADFQKTLAERSWFGVQAIRQGGRFPHTFGEHRPDYSPGYAFGRFYIQGVRERYRRTGFNLRETMPRLAGSDHPCSVVALLGLAHGAFSETDRDTRQPYTQNPDFGILRNLQEASSEAKGVALTLPPLEADLRSSFRRFLNHGALLREAGAYTTLAVQLRALAGCTDLASWIAALALGHGVFLKEDPDEAADAAFDGLWQLMPERWRAANPLECSGTALPTGASQSRK